MNKNEVIEKIKDTIKANIRREAQYIYIHHELSRILARFNGKKITRRMANAIQKERPDWNVNYSVDHIKLWGKSLGRDYNNLISVHIAAYKQTHFDIDLFETLDNCHGSAAIARNKARSKDLRKAEAIAEALSVFEKAHTQMTKVLNRQNVESFYSIRDALNLDGKLG